MGGTIVQCPVPNFTMLLEHFLGWLLGIVPSFAIQLLGSLDPPPPFGVLSIPIQTSWSSIVWCAHVMVSSWVLVWHSELTSYTEFAALHTLHASKRLTHLKKLTKYLHIQFPRQEGHSLLAIGGVKSDVPF